MLSFAVTSETRVDTMSDLALSLLRMQAPSRATVPGYCALTRLSATSKVTLEAMLQLSVAVCMAAMFLVGTKVVQCWRAARCSGGSTSTARLRQRLLPPRQPQPEDPAPHSETYWDWDTAVPTTQQGEGRGGASRRIDSSTGVVASGGEGSRAREGAVPPIRARLATAAVNYGLTAYATLTVASVKLLHCVWVPGTAPASRHLFIRGSMACDYSGWQAPYIALLAVLVAVPLALPLLAAWSRREPGLFSPNSLVCADLRVGVRRALVESYAPHAFWWEAVLMAQRLVGGSCLMT